MLALMMVPTKKSSVSKTSFRLLNRRLKRLASEVDPEAKKVKSWRHALQRGFLLKDREVNPDDLEHLDKTMKLAENYDGITVDILKVTKIGKVMRRIVTLEQEIPRESDFNFRGRANQLCIKWQVSIWAFSA